MNKIVHAPIGVKNVHNNFANNLKKYTETKQYFLLS